MAAPAKSLSLHKKQMEVYSSKHRFRVVVAGRRWGKTALHNALVSDNSLGIIEVLLEHGADPAPLGDSGHGWRGPRLSSKYSASTHPPKACIHSSL